jgi:5'-3' exonuclease
VLRRPHPSGHAGRVTPDPVQRPPLLLAVDGDGLLHRAHHALADGEHRDDDGRPVWALRGLVVAIATAVARLAPDALLVGFDSHTDAVRKADFPGYKAHRAEKHSDLQEQLDAAPRLLADGGVCVFSPPGYEADDVLASGSALARRQGWRSVLVTSDRDSFALIEESTSVLRVCNGGIDDSPVVTADDLPALCGVTPPQYRDFAALRGDASDNLPGAHGIGGKTAARLLAAFAGVDDAYAALDGGRRDQVVAAVGETATDRLADPLSRERVARNQRLMAMRDDLDLPDPDAMRLPLDGRRLRTALAARGIRLTGSLWAMVGEPRPVWLTPGIDRAPHYLPGSGAPGDRRAQPLAAIRKVLQLPEPDPEVVAAARARLRAMVRPTRRAALVVPDDQLSLF